MIAVKVAMTIMTWASIATEDEVITALEAAELVRLVARDLGVEAQIEIN